MSLLDLDKVRTKTSREVSHPRSITPCQPGTVLLWIEIDSDDGAPKAWAAPCLGMALVDVYCAQQDSRGTEQYFGPGAFPSIVPIWQPPGEGIVEPYNNSDFEGLIVPPTATAGHVIFWICTHLEEEHRAQAWEVARAELAKAGIAL